MLLALAIAQVQVDLGAARLLIAAQSWPAFFFGPMMLLCRVIEKILTVQPEFQSRMNRPRDAAHL